MPHSARAEAVVQHMSSIRSASNDVPYVKGISSVICIIYLMLSKL